MPTKAEVTQKIEGLRDLANQLPAGAGKVAIGNMVAKMSTLADSVLNDDGTTHPLATTFVPARGLSPTALSDGDGHAVTCC
ncbi:hypothetical protein RZS28_10980 [Methylocapsa polymorpha]|uniref:Uncharacterized protein n=1 Tax=Methylocapsa polymorpha TaxID=3080828 RepID=A0ABZ0HM41_9HYPH|nr:hypothetical protein RZS28_10980 [Methylocapsa sp. RX1]